MARKYRNLIDRIVADNNMRFALKRTARGRRLTSSALDFKEFFEVNLMNLSAEIRGGTYKPDPVRQFSVLEPKPRLITAHSFRDRVAQHALVAIIGPILDRTLLPRTFACRKGMGTHCGVLALQADLVRLGSPLYALKTDFSKYFHSINRAVVHSLIRRKISCAATLRLIEAITPPEGVGLPIGSLTSQLYANLYGGVVDRYLNDVLGERHWFRYMDDIVVLGRDPARLREVRGSIEELAARELKLTFSKWSIQSVARGVNFLGYRVWSDHRLLRRQSVTRAKRAIRSLRARGDTERLDKFIAAWSGHADFANTFNLRLSMGLSSHDHQQQSRS